MNRTQRWRDNVGQTNVGVSPPTPGQFSKKGTLSRNRTKRRAQRSATSFQQSRGSESLSAFPPMIQRTARGPASIANCDVLHTPSLSLTVPRMKVKSEAKGRLKMRDLPAFANHHPVKAFVACSATRFRQKALEIRYEIIFSSKHFVVGRRVFPRAALEWQFCKPPSLCFLAAISALSTPSRGSFTHATFYRPCLSLLESSRVRTDSVLGCVCFRPGVLSCLTLASIASLCLVCPAFCASLVIRPDFPFGLSRFAQSLGASSAHAFSGSLASIRSSGRAPLLPYSLVAVLMSFALRRVSSQTPRILLSSYIAR
jgi:hypothetical protein